ncbi:hypothetical protein JAAARDRAFT_28695 [Jaapia argillacea MUCL 33604]|uniref:MBOAT-domain-containing protein n=1 Tax=Jaapia argillacea MUCL 33604 TaxID=933084 RepID=A0A067QNA8_9AGAM|nr:hypothetical protein JAAARDRAFT_28695 [Jaapia argillacea MUCL 33604]
MDALFVPLASAVGASVDQVKLITCLLVSYPLGSLFIRVPSSSPNLKHLFNLSIALFYFLPVLNLWTGFAQLLASTMGTYFIAKYVQGPRMPWIAFTFVMGHLLINHIIRAVFDLSYETFEVTGPQMVLTMKLTTFAWNVWDGRRNVEELDKWQQQMRVTKFPSPLAFLGYAFYFPGVLVGPYLEFNSYQSLIDESLFKSAQSPNLDSKKKRAVPDGRKRVAYGKMVKGLVFLGLYIFLYGSFNYTVVTAAWFQKKSLWYRLGYYQICGFFERTKYYAIWTLTEGAAILTGFGFTGFDSKGRSLWDGARNVKIRSIELAPNFKVLLDSWNMKTNVWLRECVYKRVTPKGQKPGFRSSMLTFTTSALWHGVSGGYYLTFLLGGFIQTAGRLCRANIRPLLLPVDLSPRPTPPVKSNSGMTIPMPSPPPPPPTLAKKIYDYLGIACSILLVNYATAPFMLLTIRDSLIGWHMIGWYGHWMIAAVFAFFYGGGRAWLKGLQTARVKKAEKAGGVVREPVGTPGDRTPGIYYMPPPVEDAVEEIEKELKRLEHRGEGVEATNGKK